MKKIVLIVFIISVLILTGCNINNTDDSLENKDNLKQENVQNDSGEFHNNSHSGEVNDNNEENIESSSDTTNDLLVVVSQIHEDDIFPYSSLRIIDEEEYYTAIKYLELEELEIANNEIFARHGHDFSSKILKEYFDSRDWYKPINGKKVSVSELNKIEQENVALIDKMIERRKTEKRIAIIEEIKTPKLEFDWDLELNKYPLEQRILCYESEYNQGNEKNKLSIYFCGYSYNDYVDSNYEIIINNTTDKFIADDIYIVDLNENDEYIEIVVNDGWENGVWSSIYRYINNELICLGSSTDYIEECINYYGKYVPSYNIYHFLEEPLIPRYSTIENGKFVRKFTQYEDVKDKIYTVTQEVLDEIECYDKLKIGDKIKILSLTDETDNITGDSQGVVLRVMNENGEIFEIGYVGSWA